MKLRHMQCLCTLADCGFNVSRAAEELHATQPAVGKQLRLLEEELGVEIFRRRGAKFVGLSPVGEQVLQWSRTAMQAAGNIKQLAMDARAQGRGAIVIATTHTHARYILLDAIRAFTERLPAVRLHLLQGTPDGVLGLVHDGKADIGVTTPPAAAPPDIVAAPFLDVPQVLIMPPGHPLLAAPTLRLEDIAAYPLVAHNPGRPMGEKIARKFRDAGVQIRYSVEALDADVMKSYVAAGLGIAIIPRITYDPQRDSGLAMRDISHIFEPMVSCVLMRRCTYLGGSVYEFLHMLSPRLERATLDALHQGHAGPPPLDPNRK